MKVLKNATTGKLISVNDKLVKGSDDFTTMIVLQYAQQPGYSMFISDVPKEPKFISGLATSQQGSSSAIYGFTTTGEPGAIAARSASSSGSGSWIYQPNDKRLIIQFPTGGIYFSTTGRYRVYITY